MPRPAIILAIFLTLLALAVVGRLHLAGELSTLSDAARAQAMEFRAQRAACAGVVGLALGVSGVLLQALLRNPLASPDVLGVSSGSSLAVMIGVYLQHRAGVRAGPGSVAGLTWQGGPALLGAAGALTLVYLLSRRRAGLDPLAMVLVGVIVGIVCGAGVMLVQHLMPDVGFASVRLLIGGLSDETGWGEALLIGTIVLATSVGAWSLGRAIDASALGSDEAVSVGVRVGALRLTLFGLCGLLTACAVVLAGPVGFVGLVCPHAARLGLGRDAGARWVIAGAGLAGASLLIGADWLVQGINLGSGRLPIGILTALLGGPALIVLLRRAGPR